MKVLYVDTSSDYLYSGIVGKIEKIFINFMFFLLKFV